MEPPGDLLFARNWRFPHGPDTSTVQRLPLAHIQHHQRHRQDAAASVLDGVPSGGGQACWREK